VALAVGAIPLQSGVAGLRRLRAPDLRAAFHVGLPVGLHMLAEVAIFAMVGFLAGRLGAGPLAAHQVAISVATLTFTIAVGLGSGGSVRVGWAVGSRDGAGVRRAGLVALGAGAGFMSCSALALALLAGPIARAFSGDAAVVAAAVPLLRVAAIFQISDGIQAVGAGVLRGAGETRFTFAANMLGHWGLGFPCAVALGLGAGMGVTGLWWGFVIGLSAVAVALLLRFVRISSREILPLQEREAAGG
jgi:MATE family multidrug resistance protein